MTANRPEGWTSYHKNSAHPLAKWRFKRRLSGEAFIEKLQPLLPPGITMSVSTLSRYEAGAIMRPTPEIVVAIGTLTRNAIKYADLCRPRQPRPSTKRRARSNP